MALCILGLPSWGQPDIEEIRYFFDTDPGVGLGTLITITPGQTIDITVDLPQGLSEGPHTLYVRAKDENGIWGMMEKRPFIVQTLPPTNPPTPNLTKVEYFVDDYELPGMGTDVPIGMQPTIDVNILVSSLGLSDGYHMIYARAKDKNGVWGITETRPILIIAPSGAGSVDDITKIEYFFNNDPGIGLATDLPITPGVVVDIMSVDLTHALPLPVGTNSVTVRAQNAVGAWGPGELREFNVLDDCTQPTADFTIQLACASETVNFTDISLNIQPDAQYRWYFDGDTTPDDFTVGSTSFVFTNPGDYQVSLAISQGMICYDSIGFDITILAKPVVVFNADPVEEGIPTNFEVTQFNVDPSATWSWDFDNDAIEDDNTAGNTAFVYPNFGNYLASVLVSDGNGCETGFSRMVTVSAPGGGGTPTANFTAPTVCIGETTIFTDLSIDIPGTALYSWDFDNDGLEDDNTPGSTTYTYPSSGDFIAVLQIDLGGGVIITHSEMVSVNPIPVASFTADIVCLGSTTTFTDFTNGTIAGTTYSWDFDGDGLEDDNTTGNSTFIYSSPGVFTALLLVDNGSGCFDATSRNIQVQQQPSAKFTVGQACTGESMEFTDMSTALETEVTYSWDFDGDGTEDDNTVDNTTYVFNNAGTFDPVLVVDNGSGCQSTFTIQVEINDIPGVGFTIDASCFDQATLFIDNSTNVDTDAFYSWDFDGDGIEDDDNNDSNTFNYGQPGNYRTALTVDNGGGCESTVTREVIFEDVAQVNFVASAACAGEPTTFTDLSTGVGTNPVYSWDFENDGGEDSTVPAGTTHIFDSAGTYTTRLTIFKQGCNSSSLQVVVNDLPTIYLGSEVSICEGESVTLDPGPGFVNYQWSNGSNNQSLTVKKEGLYFVTATNNNKCQVSDSVIVDLEVLPDAAFDYSIEIFEFSVMVQFENQSVDADQYNWSFGDQNLSADINPSHEYAGIDIFEGSSFEVCLTAMNQCEEITTCDMLFLSVTGNQENGLKKLVQVYPNPSSSGRFNLLLDPERETKLEALVYNINGQLVWSNSQLVEQNTIDLNGYPKGVYLMKLVGHEEIYTQRPIYQ